jgi:hypothetical protein
MSSVQLNDILKQISKPPGPPILCALNILILPSNFGWPADVPAERGKFLRRKTPHTNVTAKPKLSVDDLDEFNVNSLQI